MIQFSDSQRVIYRKCERGTVISETADNNYDVELDSGHLIEAAASDLEAVCVTCRLAISPSGKYEGSWEDSYGSAFGPDHGNGKRPYGATYYHRHYPHAKILRREHLTYLPPTGSNCESCSGDMRTHDWVAMDVNGFVLWCDRNPTNGES